MSSTSISGVPGDLDRLGPTALEDTWLERRSGVVHPVFADRMMPTRPLA
jgi:hypothetical protein